MYAAEAQSSSRGWADLFKRPKSEAILSYSIEALTSDIPTGVHKALFIHWLGYLRPDAIPPRSVPQDRAYVDYFDYIALIDIQNNGGHVEFMPLVVGQTVEAMLPGYCPHALVPTGRLQLEYGMLNGLHADVVADLWPSVDTCVDPGTGTVYSQSAFPIVSGAGNVVQLLCGFEFER